MWVRPPPATRMIKCPKGYHFVVTAPRPTRSIAYNSNSLPTSEVRSIWIELYNSKTKEKIGYVDLVLTKYNFWETHSTLDDEEQGKGLGVLMYAKAIDVGLKNELVVKSSTAPSDDAKRTWKSRRLNALYEIKQQNKRFHVISRKTQHNQ